MFPALGYVYAAATAIAFGLMIGDVAAAGVRDADQQARVVAQAQMQTQEQAQMGEQATAADFTDAQVERFARAHRQIVMLQQQYPDPAQEAQLRDLAAEAIAAQGLTIDEYNRIYSAARQDPDLRRMVVEDVRAMGGAQPPGLNR